MDLKEENKEVVCLEIFSELFCELGKITVFFSNIEFFVTELLVYFINKESPVIGIVIVNEYPISKKIDLLRQLMKQTGSVSLEDKKVDAISNILDKVDIIREERNKFTHNMWILNEERYPDIKQFHIKFKKTKDGRKRVVSCVEVEKIKEIAIEVQKISEELYFLSRELVGSR